MKKDFRRFQPPVLPIEKVVIPDVMCTYLDNGVPLYIIDAGNEDIVRMEIVFRAGQVKEPYPLIASTANMMLTEGTTEHDAIEINRLFDYYGTFLNLTPEKDMAGVVVFFINKHIDKVLDLVSEMVFRPAFPEAELDALMKKRLRWYQVNRERVANKAMDHFFESAFGPMHPYGKQIREENFESVSRQDVCDFHRKYYTPGNMAIILSGKIHPEAQAMINHYLGGITTTGNYSGEEISPPQGTGSGEIAIRKSGALQTAIRIGSATINKRDPDYPGFKVLNTILGGFFGSRLMKNIREEKGYTYGISSSLASLDLAGYKVISTEVNPKNTKAVINEIIREIRLLHDIPVNEEELTVIRNYMSGEMLRMFDGPFAIAESFRSAWEFGLDTGYYRKFSEKILNIQPDEITRLARTYYKIEDLYTVTVGPE